jgi:hypothetical protein
MAKQMEAFKGYLEDFAAKHKDQIKKDSEFRVAFQEMCSTIGVDPLACKYYNIAADEPVHVVTSIKQPPVIKGHFFVLS